MVVVFNTYTLCNNSRRYKKNSAKPNLGNVNFKRMMPTKPALSLLKKIFIKDSHLISLKTKDGIEIKAKLEKPARFYWYLTHKHKCLGMVWLSRCSAHMKGDSVPEYYNDKEYLFINSLNSNEKCCGIGTQIVKAVVEESQKLGFEGRVCLNTTTTKPDIGSPVPFYHKLGFKSTNSEIESLIENCIATKQPLPKNCESTTMFLPKEVIAELLAKY